MQSNMQESEFEPEQGDDPTQNKKHQVEFISHELKTPLACTLIFIQSLMALDLPDTAMNYIKMIESQINLSLNLVSDFQDANLMYVGKLKPKIEIFDPKKIFEFR